MKPPDRGHELTIGYGLPRRGLPSAASFRLWMTRALPSRSRPVTISLRLVDEAEGRSLNANFRGRDYATNVLSFTAGDARLEDGTRLLGDIAICAPVVAREAVEQSKPPRSHFAHLTVHGVLHLLGYDHVEPSDAESMERKECLLLRQLGFPNPYKT